MVSYNMVYLELPRFSIKSTYQEHFQLIVILKRIIIMFLTSAPLNEINKLTKDENKNEHSKLPPR